MAYVPAMVQNGSKIHCPLKDEYVSAVEQSILALHDAALDAGMAFFAVLRKATQDNWH